MADETLFMVMIDVEPSSIEMAFNAWYNDEHVPELLRVPGFLSGARFRAMHGGPKYVAMYRLADLSALDEPLFHQARPAHRDSTPATKQMWTHIRNLRRGIYRRLANTPPAARADRNWARFLLLAGLDIAPELDAAFQDWLVGQYLPGLAAAEGVLGASGYQLDPRSTDHSDAPGRYLLLHDLANANAGDAAAWLSAPGAPWAENLANPTYAAPRMLYERLYPA